jgi:site-specific DNA-cytosine methylase
MTLPLTDLFCGAGGSSTGAIQVPGVEARLAANHWRLATETHNTSHPLAATSAPPDQSGAGLHSPALHSESSGEFDDHKQPGT